MNLVLITALVAVTSAAKLDRTYLPPLSAKTAGGSPESLQTPFAGNSFNNGLGGLPKGSYNNEFQGVVVDAAAAGTRASESAESGLGAPRIAYGSTDSKVGAAAFKANPDGFSQPANFQTRFGGTAPEGQVSGSISQGVQAQGSFQQQGSQGFSNPERARAALDRAATTIRFESEVGPESFNYAFETDNGITAEESGVATNGVQAQGGFSYTGDDGQVYSVTYTADERGYLPQGDHLPTPPPIPEEILKSLEQNAREEAAGLLDDGSYDAQKYNAGSDYAETDDENGKYNHQSSKFGNRNEADATASGTFISQSNQPFARPGQSASNSLLGSIEASNRFGSGSGTLEATGQRLNDPSGLNAASGSFGLGQSGTVDSNGQSGSNSLSGSNRFASSSNKFGQSETFATTGQSSNDPSRQNEASAQFGSGSNGSSGHSGNAGSQGQFAFSSTGLGNSRQEVTPSFSGNFAHSSSEGLVGSSNQGSRLDGSGLSTSNRFSEENGQNSLDSAHSQSTNSFGPSSNGDNNLAEDGQSAQGNSFGNKNGYLPPKYGSNQNRPQSVRPQGFGASNNDNAQQFDHTSNTNNQDENVQPLSQQKLQDDSRPQGSISVTSPFRKPSSNGLSGQSGFGSTTGATAQTQLSNNAFRPSSNGDNSFVQASSSSSPAFGNRFGSKNEYLPPVNNFNQNSRPNQQRPQGSDSLSTIPNPQFNQQSITNTQTFGSFQDSSSSTASTYGSQPSFGAQTTQKFNSFQKPQSSTKGKPISQDAIRFPSTQVAGQTQSTSGFSSFASQRATSQPDTELTTPFESSGPQHNAADTSSSPTISSFTSTVPHPSNRQPTQSQFGTKFNNEVNASPVPTTPSVFPSFNTQSAFGPKTPSSQTFSNGQSQSSITSRFGNKQQKSPQTSFSQNDDAQFSPSTPRPDYSQQPQGPDDSYYYNQPSRPFGTPQGSKFPNAPSNNFNKVTQGPSSQINQFLNTPTAFSNQNGQFQGSTKYPRPPTIAPVAPTSSSQQSNAFSGITQASISPFPSEAPTKSSSFNKQDQFGSRPNYQQSSNQFSQSQIQSSKPSFGQQSTSSQQTTAIPSFSQRFGNKPSIQGQSQTFGQQSFNENQPELSDDTSESTPSQQYDTELYEYKKPPQSLPAPDHQETTSDAGQFGHKEQTQFGNKPSRPQFGQTNGDDNQGSTTVQFGQTVQSSKPQFGDSLKPQFGQNTQIQNKFDAEGLSFKKQSPLATRPQFGSQPTRPFGSQQLNSQFDQGADSQEPQPTQASGPKYGAQNIVRPFSSCCQFGAQTGQQDKDFGVQTQNRFSVQSSSFSSTQGFKADPTTSSFAGKGEVFGGPRKPPSFDPETGYHY